MFPQSVPCRPPKTKSAPVCRVGAYSGWARTPGAHPRRGRPLGRFAYRRSCRRRRQPRRGRASGRSRQARTLVPWVLRPGPATDRCTPEAPCRPGGLTAALRIVTSPSTGHHDPRSPKLRKPLGPTGSPTWWHRSAAGPTSRLAVSAAPGTSWSRPRPPPPEPGCASLWPLWAAARLFPQGHRPEPSHARGARARRRRDQQSPPQDIPRLGSPDRPAQQRPARGGRLNRSPVCSAPKDRRRVAVHLR